MYLYHFRINQSQELGPLTASFRIYFSMFRLCTSRLPLTLKNIPKQQRFSPSFNNGIVHLLIECAGSSTQFGQSPVKNEKTFNDYPFLENIKNVFLLYILRFFFIIITVIEKFNSKYRNRIVTFLDLWFRTVIFMINWVIIFISY